MRKYLLVFITIVSIVAVACGSAQTVAEPDTSSQSESSRTTVRELPTRTGAAPSSEPAPAAPSAPEPQAAAAPAAAPAPASAAPPPVSQQAVAEPAPNVPQGGVFTRLWADPPTLDPALTGDTRSAGIVVEVFSGLVAFDTDLRIVPDIAESWEISENGTVYTFRIRPNARFHDGKPVTAHDFKYSLERAANPDTPSPTADTYLGDIIGVYDVLNGDTTDISGVKVIDEDEFDKMLEG